MSKLPVAPKGCSEIPGGHIATIVTNLEMLQKPLLRPATMPEDVTFVRMVDPDLSEYRALFLKVGERWMWFSRVLMEDGALREILTNPKVESFEIREGNEAIGLLELDFSELDQCELSFLGLTAAATGKGLGRAIMNVAVEQAWSRQIRRFWVHTCTFDHPAALEFYIRTGFTPFSRQLEVVPDPRLSGVLPMHAAPHVPIIQPQP
ncbi:GNAT family N-acetyltransferase [Paracoccus suum]|uniref:GNAT family N-acetyltransferase n=1 Tax=Paracoccus suum TaxID=2259340 RepID=A0A344PK13_9RHOB|nr:GNAT family N-acetyltransferase [Paracoccus suum]AXC49718.1 GNAT family N-acetyltransferase [Paracoccus suum]